jgi:hypothetical protein
MTRRQFFSAAATAGSLPTASHAVVVPVRHIVDGLAKWAPGEVERFWRRLWPAAARQLARCGVRFESSYGAGGVWRPPGREPMISGLQRRMLNLVITNRIPMEWDRGRALSGVTACYRGFHLCMIAMDHAHGLEIPLVSVNTCTHELLHALLLDIFEDRPGGVAGQFREFRIDWYATSLWLGTGSAEVRESASRYVSRLKQG